MRNLEMPLSSNKNLGRIGRSHEIDTLLNTSDLARGEVNSDSVATAVEAIVGAAYLGDGRTSVNAVMLKLGLMPTTRTWNARL